jgi:hypothetical protein
MRERLAKLKAAGKGDIKAQDVWAQVDLIPGPGMKLDASKGSFSGVMRADEVPEQVPARTADKLPLDARKALKSIADDMRVKLKK